jgi:hypothetical protein
VRRKRALVDAFPLHMKRRAWRLVPHCLSHGIGSLGLMEDRRLQLNRPCSLRLTLSPLRNGRFDPCVRSDPSGFWRATRTPDGPALTLLQEEPNDVVRMRAWGSGALWCVEQLPELLGEHQVEETFDHADVARFAHKLQGLRIPRALSLVEMAVPIILQQRVTTGEAFRSYRQITRALSEPAPGPNPAALLLPPLPSRLAETPTWWFHKFGVERKRAQAVREICVRAGRIDSLASLPHLEARQLLQAVPGVGLWTAGMLGLYGLGDQDSVIIGDLHFPNHVAWTMAREARGDDKRMLELLEPFRGQRGRALRLITSGSPGAPKFGPKYSPISIASY